MTNLLVFRCSCKFCSPSHRADLTPLASPRTISQTRGLHSLSRTAKRYSRTRTSAYGTNPFLALARLFFLLPRASSRVVPEARTKANILGPSPQHLLLILFSFFIAQRSRAISRIAYRSFLALVLKARTLWRALDQTVARVIRTPSYLVVLLWCIAGIAFSQNSSLTCHVRCRTRRLLRAPLFKRIEIFAGPRAEGQTVGVVDYLFLAKRMA